MSLPTFLIIGAMKAGTTALAVTLAKHPDVWMSPIKEPHFFVPGWPAERRGLDWYRSLFNGGEDLPCRGEASTTYTMAPVVDGVAPRIAELLPDVRLVYLVRDPVDRIRSMYLHALATGRERRPLGRAVREDPRYLAVSRHAFQLDRYTEHFDASQILVLRSRDLRDDADTTLPRVCEHIGADPSRAPERTEIAHVSAGKRVPRNLTRALPGLTVRIGKASLSPWLERGLTRNLRGADRDVRPELRAWIEDQLAEDHDVLRRRWAVEPNGA